MSESRLQGSKTVKNGQEMTKKPKIGLEIGLEIAFHKKKLSWLIRYTSIASYNKRKKYSMLLHKL